MSENSKSNAQFRQPSTQNQTYRTIKFIPLIICKLFTTFYFHYIFFLLFFLISSQNFALNQTFTNYSNINFASCISQDNTIFITASRDTHLIIYIWNPSTLQYSQSQIIMADSNGLQSCDIINNNSLIISAGFDKTIKIWKLNPLNNSYEISQTLSQHTETVNFVKFNQNSNMIVSVSFDNTVIVWKWDNNQFIYNQTLTGHTNQIYMCDISFDSTVIITGGSDKTTKIWKLIGTTYSLLQTLSFSSNVYQLALTDNYNKILNGLTHQIEIWVYNSSTGYYFLNETLSNHTGDVFFYIQQTNYLIYSGSSNDYYINIWQFNQSSNNYQLYHSFTTTDITISILANRYNSKIFNTGWSCNFYQYLLSFNCSLDPNSNGTNYLLNTCICIQNYHWNYIDIVCQRNCTLDANSNGTNRNQTVCYCNSNYVWSDALGYCQYNCSLDKNSNGLNYNATSCQCKLDYYWRQSFLDPKVDYCQFDTLTIHFLYKIIVTIISTPTISLVFQFIQPFLKFTDDFYYYIYHKRDYDSNLIYFMSMMFNITQNKWIPSYINQYVILYSSTLNVETNALTDIYHKTPTHFSRLGEDIFFLKNTFDYFTSTIPLSLFIFMLLKFIYRTKKYRLVSKLLYKYSSYCFLMSALIGDNIQYLSFRCFSQIYFIIPTIRFSYINLIICYLILFCIVVYSVGAFFLFKSFFKSKFKEVLEVLHGSIRSAAFMSIQLGLNVLSGFTHATLYYSPYTQMSILVSIQIIRVVILVWFGNQFKSKLFKLLLICEYLLRSILHIFFMIQLRLIQVDGLTTDLIQNLGDIQINLIIIILLVNIFQSFTILTGNSIRQDELINELKKQRIKFELFDKNTVNQIKNKSSQNKVCGSHLNRQKQKYKIRYVKIFIQKKFKQIQQSN